MCGNTTTKDGANLGRNRPRREISSTTWVCHPTQVFKQGTGGQSIVQGKGRNRDININISFQITFKVTKLNKLSQGQGGARDEKASEERGLRQLTGWLP